MRSVFILLFFFVSGHGFSQVLADPQVKQFLNEFVKHYEKKDNLYYDAYLQPDMTDQIIRTLNYREGDSIFREPDDRKRATFVLSPEEKEQIKKIWLAQKNKAWDSNLIEHATIFSAKPIPENFTREQSREYQKQFEGKHIIKFSVPVFLRNNSLCIFYYVTPDSGTLYILKRENEKWVKLLFRTIVLS